MGIYTEMIKQRVFSTFFRVFFDGRLYLLSSSDPTGYSPCPVIFGLDPGTPLIVIFGLDPEIQGREVLVILRDPAFWISAFAGMTR